MNQVSDVGNWVNGIATYDVTGSQKKVRGITSLWDVLNVKSTLR